MSVLTVPLLETEPWPSLGGQVCDFIESYLVFGPGDLRGQPARLDDEKRWLIWRMYEVYPQDHPQAGRRRFKRVALSLRKGTAKTELSAWIAVPELHPDGPVRTVGWDGHGNPIGGPVTDPYIPMIAYTEEQTEELAYGALKCILEESPLAGDFDIGLARIMRRRGDGKAIALATAPDSADGARTTFQCFDETHRLVLPRHLEAHRTMMANIPKRKLADAWSFETTTAYSPGEGSVAEKTMEYARQVASEAIKDSRLFFFHRQAGEDIKVYDESGAVDMAAAREAVLEASGPTAEWSDIESILEQFADPSSDKAYLERVWLNRPLRQSGRAFDTERWAALAKEGYTVPDGALITIGFDGAQFHDSTSMVGTEISTGYQWEIGLWERPGSAGDDYQVDVSQVDATLEDVFTRYDVWRMYADPPYWQEQVAKWSGRFGEKRMIEWYTNRYRQMAYAVRGFVEAIATGALSHNGKKSFARHIGNACRRDIRERDDQGKPLWIIQKERPDSVHKMDEAMAAILSWQARCDALASGVGQVQTGDPTILSLSW